MKIVDDGLTAEQFRAHPEFRKELDDFLKTPAGAHMLYILNEGSQPVTKPLSFPQDRLEELHASEYRANMGWRKCVTTLKTLAKPMPAPDVVTTEPAALGAKRTKEELDKRIPPFVIPATDETKNTPPTT